MDELNGMPLKYLISNVEDILTTEYIRRMID